MSHTKPYIRKKAVLIMYKVFLKYPESLRPAFPRLKEKLEDPDPGNREQRARWSGRKNARLGRIPDSVVLMEMF